MRRVFIIDSKHPTRNIREVQASIVTKKFSWAVVFDKYGQERRYLLGATAFFTLPSALRAKVGYLQKIVANTAIRWIAPGTYAKAQLQLEQSKHGVLH